jgi:hypothetical protein
MIHRVRICALRLARNSLSGWKLASSEYFDFFYQILPRRATSVAGHLVECADHSFGTAEQLAKIEITWGLEKDDGVHWGAHKALR